MEGYKVVEVTGKLEDYGAFNFGNGLLLAVVILAGIYFFTKGGGK